MPSNVVSPFTTFAPLSVNQTYDVNVTAMLMCTSLGGPNNTYQWKANDTDIPGEIMEVLVLADVDASTGGVYTCVVTNAAGSDSDSTFIFIAPYFITQPVNEETDNGSPVTLQCAAKAFPSPSYQWARTDQILVRQGLINDSNMLVFNPALFGDEGDYFCNASSRDEVARSQDVTLTGSLVFGNAELITPTIKPHSNDHTLWNFMSLRWWASQSFINTPK